MKRSAALIYRALGVTSVLILASSPLPASGPPGPVPATDRAKIGPFPHPAVQLPPLTEFGAPRPAQAQFRTVFPAESASQPGAPPVHQASPPQAQPSRSKPQRATQASAAQPLLLRNHAVVDQQGFGTEAMHMLIPKDWRFDGGVTWDLMKSPPVALMAFTISSPDGFSVLEKPADMNFMWCQNPNVNYTYGQMGQAVMQPMGAVEFLRNFYIPRVRSAVSDLRVLETQPLPALAQYVLARAEALLGIFHQISPPVSASQSRTESARVKVEYTFNGRRMTEDFTASVTFSTTTMNSMYGAVPLVFWMPQVMSFRAPSEEMPAKVRLFQIMMYSGAENPVWTVNCIRLQAIVTRENLRHQQAIFARLRQIRETQSEIGDMVWDTMRRRSQAQDRMFDNYSQALRGVDTYVNPNGGFSVELPTGFDSVWTNGTDYILSDSPTYNPSAAGAAGSWTQMNRRR